eukprot:jgi/Tetstr1/427960/TSEL_018034.t1
MDGYFHGPSSALDAVLKPMTSITDPHAGQGAPYKQIDDECRVERHMSDEDELRARARERAAYTQTRSYMAVVENMFKSFFHQEDFYVLLHRQK